MTQRTHGVEELRAEVVIAALALNRLGDETSYVVRVFGEGAPRLC
ncbi:Uncharacterised protein [Mycobacteroides abscessus subsp. abscessus]|nr:Uncharacterised protein [Mycobacteroides abscessus subsp. abscessus]